MADNSDAVSVLVIDDERYVRESIKGFLEDYDYTVTEAENGLVAMAHFEAEKPDIVLCDLKMPEVDGFKVLAWVVETSPETPVIIISGAGNITDTVDALRLGAWDYIIKPVQDMMVLFHSIEKCLERSQLIKEKKEYQEGLERVNAQLIQSLEALEKTRDQLVQSEKMAALGGLVAGVAHEINTPVGIGITAASYLKDRTHAIETLFKSGDLRKSALESYLQNMGEVSQSILINMERAASLIQSFKQVAVDQVVEEKRVFAFKRYLENVLMSLKPSYRQYPEISIIVDCSDKIQIRSYPGAFSQIFSNLVINSLTHGFRDEKSGEILFEVRSENRALVIDYRDTGVGMTEEQVGKVFDPFFTTTRGQGGTGLGMSIVFNLVTQTLGGVIKCRSVWGEGVNFSMTIPDVIEA